LRVKRYFSKLWREWKCVKWLSFWWVCAVYKFPIATFLNVLNNVSTTKSRVKLLKFISQQQKKSANDEYSRTCGWEKRVRGNSSIFVSSWRKASSSSSSACCFTKLVITFSSIENLLLLLSTCSKLNFEV
jgi:hypothetical protein